MVSRTVNLTDHFDRFVVEQVESGRFRDASDVMRAGLRLLERETREDREKLALLRKLADEAFDQLDQGEGIAIEGEEELATFVGRVGRRAARSTSRRATSG